MRSLTLCLLALMCFGGLNAQQIHLSGSVIDLKDGSPIASATISVLSKKYFTRLIIKVNLILMIAE